MKLTGATYDKFKGRRFRSRLWGWRDGNTDGHNGYAYINEDNTLYFRSDITAPYDYSGDNRADKDYWYEVDVNGYPIPESGIYIGGE